MAPILASNTLTQGTPRVPNRPAEGTDGTEGTSESERQCLFLVISTCVSRYVIGGCEA